MVRGRVLVIDGDEWLGKLLARALTEKGYTVDVCEEARAGFDKACATAPDCIVCSLELPDIDGLWVARRVRTESGPLARTPFLFVCEDADPESRVQALRVGADALVARPVSNEHLAAQVEALIAMAQRLGRSGSEGSGPPSSTSLAAAIRGDLAMFPLASVLMMFEMERRSGTLDVVAASGTRAKIILSDGLFAVTEIGGTALPALEVLREVLGWRSGRFAFRPRDGGSLPPPRASVGALVLEAMRLEDEKKTAL